MHWYGTLETFALSGLTTILCIYLFVRVKDVAPDSAVLGSAATLAMVTTNWMLGIALMGMKFPLSRFLRYTAIALALCGAAAVGQKLIFPHANFFFYPRAVMEESQYVGIDESGRAMSAARVMEIKPRSFFISSAVAPAPRSILGSGWETIGNQDSPWSSYGIVGGIAVAAWLVMLLVSLVDLVGGVTQADAGSRRDHRLHRRAVRAPSLLWRTCLPLCGGLFHRAHGHCQHGQRGTMEARAYGRFMLLHRRRGDHQRQSFRTGGRSGADRPGSAALTKNAGRIAPGTRISSSRPDGRKHGG